MDWEIAIETARGFIELDMLDDAWMELDRVEEAQKLRLEVVHLRVEVLMHKGRWKEAMEIASCITDVCPLFANAWLSVAYCLHSMGRSAAAVDYLMKGPDYLKNHPVFHFSMGCYQDTLGDREAAHRSMVEAYKRDKTLSKVSDLTPSLILFNTVERTVAGRGPAVLKKSKKR